MSKIVRKIEKAKVYNPKTDSRYRTYIITDNKTLPDGSVVNVSDENAVLARRWVDENHK